MFADAIRHTPNLTRTYKFITNSPRLNSTAQPQQHQQRGVGAAWSLCHQHPLSLPVCKQGCVKPPIFWKQPSESCHSIGRGRWLADQCSSVLVRFAPRRASPFAFPLKPFPESDRIRVPQLNLLGLGKVV